MPRWWELPSGPGTVGVTLVDSNDRAPSEEIVEAVEAHIGEERPIGAAVTVTAAGEPGGDSGRPGFPHRRSRGRSRSGRLPGGTGGLSAHPH